jgi:Flp pilus assembly protein TadG
VGRLRRHCRGDRGAAAVEAAIILPLLIFLLFGIIEISLLLRDNIATTSLVRAGARTASALPRSSALITDTVASMEKAGSALPKDSYDELWVYRADSNGVPIGNSTSNKFGVCGTDCVRYAWNDTRDTFGKVSGSWDPLSINACPGDPNAQSVGVYLKATHSFLTGLFGSSMTVSDYAVLKFEPVATYSSTQPCKP